MNPTQEEIIAGAVAKIEQELAAVGARWLEQLEELVNRYPGGAVAVAFSLGVGLGWWIKRHK